MGDEKRIATAEMRMLRRQMDVSLLEHRRNEEIIEEANMGRIKMAIRRRRREWFGHINLIDELEDTRTVANVKMEGSAVEEDQVDTEGCSWKGY